MKRIGIAGIVLVLGIFMLPAAREFMEEIADTVMSSLTGQPYSAFLQLLTDHIYLLTFVFWIVAMLVIVFWPRGEETSEIQRR